MACKECIHRKLCKKFANPFDYDILESVGCDDFKHSQPQTNADRIRAMSDEKLADAWIRCNTICHLCAYRDECEFDEYVIYEKCKEGIMEWLKQPADMRGEEE